jgi:metallo-beta-lactamase class B
VRALAFAAALALFGATVPAAEAQSRWPANWTAPHEPFRIAGNLHYVGTAGLSAFLITTPQGHILIDGAMPESGGMIARNVEALGFKPRDVRWLLNTHAHFDHSGGLAELKRLTGARLAAMAGDRAALETGTYPGSESNTALNFSPVKVDRVLKDGDVVSVGAVELTARLTPGHSEGCTSWEIPVIVDGVRRTALLHCSSSVAANRLAPEEQYPGIIADYERTFARLRSLKADIFLAPHAEQFGLAAKRAKLKAGGPNPFVDPAELPAFAARSEAAFRADLAKQKAAR